MRQTSEYKFDDWVPIKILPDLIPVIGVITWSERERRNRRLTITQFYLGCIRDTKSLFSLGTSDWQEPADFRASLRAGLLAFRNVSFATYHAFFPIIIASLIQNR